MIDVRAAIAANEFVRLTARWVFPVSQSPIADGFVEVHDRRIVAVGTCDGRTADARTFDLGNVALLPGLVNAHAHLEFSDLAHPIEPPTPFTQWIGNLMSYRRARTRDVSELVADGIAECAQTGTAVVGEISTSDVAFHSKLVISSWGTFSTCLFSSETSTLKTCSTTLNHNLSAKGRSFGDGSKFVTASVASETASEETHFRGVIGGNLVVAFRECIAPVPERIESQIEIAREHLAHCRSLQQAGVNVLGGLSPHAPYTVLPELFERLIEIARNENAPLAVHLAETPAELEYLRNCSGEFRAMLERFGMWRDDLHAANRRPLDWLRSLATLEHALAVHGNYLDEQEIEFLARHPNVAVVYCPRTHRFFGHQPHPWRDLLARGGSVAIGTDGRSSNPDYSLWRELLLLDQLSNGALRPTILELGTRRGARALGVEANYGELAVGRAAAFCVVPLPVRNGTDEWSLLFESRSEPVGL